MTHKSILLLGNYPPPYGGVPRHLEYLAPHLAAAGWNVQVLSGGHTGVACRDGFTVHKPSRPMRLAAFLARPAAGRRHDTFPHGALLARSPRRWARYMAQAAIGRRIIREHRVSVIGAYNLMSTGPVGAMLSEEHGIPLVVTNFGEIHAAPDHLRADATLVRYVTTVARALLSCSRHCAESYGLLGMTPDVAVIPYGVDVVRFSPGNSGESVRRRLGVPEPTPVVLYVGRMVRDMGLHTFLDAIPRVARRLPDAAFVAVGTSGDLLPRAQAVARTQRLFVLPDVPFDQLPALYAAATVVVVPTLGDRACSSLAAMEAMATGKPVVATSIGGIPELVRDGDTGILIPPDDPAALAEASLRVLSDGGLRERLAAGGRRTVEAEFDQRRTGDALEALFAGLAGVDARRRAMGTAP